MLTFKCYQKVIKTVIIDFVIQVPVVVSQLLVIFDFSFFNVVCCVSFCFVLFCFRFLNVCIRRSFVFCFDKSFNHIGLVV